MNNACTFDKNVSQFIVSQFVYDNMIHVFI